jgi:uncharacterized protein (TIGR02996 family)
MLDLARWRSHGLDLAFDPDELPVRLSDRGLAELRGHLQHLDAERLARWYPRDPDGRLPLGEVVLLAELETVERANPPRATWLVVDSPTLRSASQHLTISIRAEIGRNHRHVWSTHRWLWDAREASANDATRWGVAGLADLDAKAIEKLQRMRALSAADRARLAILLSHRGHWRDALALYDITHALDELPYRHCNSGAGIEPAIWDRALDANMQTIAPWRLAAHARTAQRLFTLPGQKTSRKYSVMLGPHPTTQAPHLSLACTGTNTRLPDILFRWPPDLVERVTGVVAPPLVSIGGSSTKTATELELLAQIAEHPDDDAPRRVLADLLTERDDPRGEFITLQLHEALDVKLNKRMRKLERTHWQSWLGPLARLVEQPRFERGFLIACTLGSSKTAFDAWNLAVTPRGLAELAGVRELELPSEIPHPIAAQLLSKLALASLVATPNLFALVEKRPAVLGSPVTDADDALEAIRAATPLAPDELRLIASSPFEMSAVLRALLPAKHTLPAAIGRLSFEAGPARVVVRRDAMKRPTILEIEASTTVRITALAYQTVPSALRDCPADAFTRIELRGPALGYGLESLRAACARFVGLELVCTNE